MSVLQTLSFKPLYPTTLTNPSPRFQNPTSPDFSFFSVLSSPHRRSSKPYPLVSASSTPDHNPNPKSKTKRAAKKTAIPQEKSIDSYEKDFPQTIPRKPRRGRRSEAAAVEDFVRDTLGRTFDSIRKDNAGVLEDKGVVLKERATDGEEEEDGDGKKEVVEEEDPDWPLDADVGWGIRASDYFDKHPIRNVVDNGVEIDWEGEMDDTWVQEINCLEWESFAFHPSPLIVLVFERYNRAADNWKLLKELEKASKVYWSAKDRLPPRTVKIDINIEKDLAYALKAKECPQLLFLKGNRILYREKEIRTADELVQMIAHFYYNAKRPSWIDEKAVAPRFN